MSKRLTQVASTPFSQLEMVVEFAVVDELHFGRTLYILV